MTVKIYPSILSGTIEAVSSKSELHRALICASFCNGPTDIIVTGSAYIDKDNIPDDINATISCLSALGSSIIFSPNKFHVCPISSMSQSPILDCRESASTLRFLLPIAAIYSRDAHFSGKGRLPERPVFELLSVLKEHGIEASSPSLPFNLSGTVSGGRFTVPGDVTSQYLSGLLLALPLLPEGSEILLSTRLSSGSYIDITLDIMSKFGVNIVNDQGRYYICDHSYYRSPGKITVSGDWSNASAFIVAGALNNKNSVTVNGLDPSSLQGDKSIIDILQQFDAISDQVHTGIHFSESNLHGTVINIDPIPDLLPVLSIAAMVSKGTTTFTNAERLREKESDRICSVEKLVNSLNGNAHSTADSITISGDSVVRGGKVDSFDDHRIVMAATIASCLSDTPITINNAEAIIKSYPTFFEDFEALGGIVHVI